MVVPPFHTPKWSFLVGKPMVIGETHHFRKPLYVTQPTRVKFLSLLRWALAPSIWINPPSLRQWIDLTRSCFVGGDYGVENQPPQKNMAIQGKVLNSFRLPQSKICSKYWDIYKMYVILLGKKRHSTCSTKGTEWLRITRSPTRTPKKSSPWNEQQSPWNLHGGPAYFQGALLLFVSGGGRLHHLTGMKPYSKIKNNID